MALALEINDLKKTYSGGVEALKGISFSVNEGDFYALLGPNGAGKSSTIGIIGSLVTKSSGNVKIFDVDIDENVPLAKTMLGVVSQEINFSQFEKVLDIVVTQAGFYGIPKKEALPKVENILKVTVDFVGEVITCIRDKDKKIISGNPEKIKKIYDTWVFSRDTRSKNPNWQLVDILT